MAPPRSAFQETFAVPELFVRLACDVHPSERGLVGVLDHPHFAITASDGTFELPHPLPPGDYVIASGHPGYRDASARIRVNGSQEIVHVSLTVRPVKEKG